MDLFSGISDNYRMELEDGYLIYIKNWISNSLADEYFNRFKYELPWSSNTIKLFGKEVKIPRKESFHATNLNLSYGYSGKRMRTNLLTPELEELRQRINKEFELNLNSVLANLYETGNDSNGWHADNERELGENPIIVSLSLGAERKFQLKHLISGKITSLCLGKGDLLLMSDNVQNSYQHQIPKMTNFHQPRINLTFRKIIG